MARTDLRFRRFFAVFAIPAALSVAIAGPATVGAGEQDRSQPAEPNLAVVTADNVLVRSGAADSYYPFGRVHRGTVVEVIGEKFNWIRVATRPPAFVAGTGQGQFFGHIIYPQAETSRFRINPDGKTGVTLGRMDVLAPNLNTNFNPSDSWKPLLRLEPATTVQIIATSTSSNNTVHRIVLPDEAEGWISKAHLRTATAEERTAWTEARKALEKKEEPALRREQRAERREESAQPRADAPKPEAERVVEAPKPEPKPQSSTPETPQPAEIVRAEESQVPKPTAPEETVEETVEIERPAQPVLAREEAIAPAAKPEEATPEKGAYAPAAEARDLTMEDLEATLLKLREATAEIAEVSQLRQMYLEFAVRNSSDRTAAAFAKARAEQLQVWREVRERQAELERIRQRARHTAEQTEMALLSIYAHADYDAIGRLSASTIFDGQRLPRMFRLQEPGTNRTLAYIEPEGHGFEMIEMLGLWLGLVGEKSYDPALRLNIITPKRIDLLAPQQ